MNFGETAWLKTVFDPFFNEGKSTVFSNVESIYFDYMLSQMIVHERRSLCSTLFIDLRNNVGYADVAKEKLKDKLKNIIIKPSITFSAGLFSIEVSGKSKRKLPEKFYMNLGEKYFFEHQIEFKKHDEVVIFSDGNNDIAIGLANKIISNDKKCIIITSTKKRYIDKNAETYDFSVENGNEINKELLLILQNVIRGSELYLTHILAKNNIVTHLTLLDQLQYINASEYAKITDSYMSNDSHSLMFSEEYIKYYTKDEEKSDLSKYAIDIAGAIKLVREFDPFNFDMLKNLYQFINVDLRSEYNEIKESFITDLISISKKKKAFESQEGRIIEKIRKFQKMNRRNISYTMTTLEIRELYESFLQCFREKFSFGVIQLGVLLQAQATNFGMLDIVTDVVAKKKYIYNKVEGKKTKEFLLHIEKFEKLLAPTIYPPNDILHAFPDLKDNIYRINTEKQIENYIYSNLIGYYSVTDSKQLSIESKKILENIYGKFLNVYKNVDDKNTDFYSSKILNNLAIYEQKYLKEKRVFSEKLLNKILREMDSCHIILLYNAIGILLNNKEKNEKMYAKVFSSYQKKYQKKSEDDFYVFYNHCLNLYIKNKEDNYPYKDIDLGKIPAIYKDQFLEGEIVKYIKKKKTSNENCYLFIDNQFWFNE